MAAAPPRLDLALALRQIAQAFARDAAPVLLLGFGMVSIPALLRAVVPPVGGAGTILAVVAGLLAALYVTIVSFGAMARLAGRPLPPGRYAATGIVASPPGFSVALLTGTGLVLAAILGLLLPGAAGWTTVRAAIWSLAALALVMTLPALPAAIAERLPPAAALRRAVLLTRGSKARIGALLLVVPGLAFGPAALLLGSDATALTSPWLWLRTGFELVAVAVTATIPAVVYMQLSGLGRLRRAAEAPAE